MIDRLAQLWSRALVAGPHWIVALVACVSGLSLWGASTLTVNTNQIDLLDPNLEAVTDVKRVVDMVGGAGYLTLALRGEDREQLLTIADGLAAKISEDPEIRRADAKIDTTFFRAHAPMYMATDDLLELKRRVMAKVKDAIKRASPFFFEITPTEPVQLELDDVLAKYQQVGKKRITDDHFISADGQMALVQIKPRWDSNDLGRTSALLDRLRPLLNQYQAAKLVEDYSPEPQPGVIEYGFTGTYKTNFDDSKEMQASLAPVSGLAFVGVLLVLLFFFRRQWLVVLLVLSGLILGILMTFGFAAVAVGELNMITGILGGILMGFGIDFGIHFAYRLRYEIRSGRNLEAAVVATVQSSGPASLASAAGIGAAFFSLLFSDFRGFSEFGLLAGVGTFLLGGVMYLWVPGVLLALERWRPGLGLRLLGGQGPATLHLRAPSRIPRPGAFLLVLGVAVVVVMTAIPRARFEYNSRALMVENQPSVRLQDEVQRRFAIGGDPVAIYTADLEETEELHRLFNPLDPQRFSTVDAAVGYFTFVPPKAQQAQNAQVLADWRAELAPIDESQIPADVLPRWQEAKKYLEAQPFGFEDLPEYYRGLVTPLPTAQHQGYLTYVYSGVDLWDGRMMLRFAEELERISAPSGREYRAAGLPILFANLARIVLADGKATMAITGALLLLILLIDLRTLRDVFLALMPLGLGMGAMLGAMALIDVPLNFMNVIVFPIVLGYGISHGVYLLHRHREGVSPGEALRSVGLAVACSTLTSLVGWAALLAAAHQGLQSMGTVACLGMLTTLVVSFGLTLPLLQWLHDRRDATKIEAAPAEAK